MSKIKVSALRWAPPVAQGLVRDLRVRWALEEAGLDYEENLVGMGPDKPDSYRQKQPFGQVPAFEEGNGLVLFESGAIVLHLAEQTEALMPMDPDARARTVTWMFAALNSVEPPIMMLNVIDMAPAEVAQGAKALRAAVLQAIQGRLDGVAAFLGAREHLVADRFTAADLLMTTVLRILRTTDLVSKMPTLEAYRLRGEARPAFQKALAAQMATFAANPPPKKG